MQRKMNKKGFTIVELVIVIVVIAILAAVLIPTFVSLVKKANLSADQQAVRQMNTVLATETDVDTLEKAINVLEENGYNAADTLVPVTKNHSFYWYKTHNIIVLVNDEDNSLVFPDDDKYANGFADAFAKTGDAQVLFNLEGGVKYIDIVASDAKSLSKAFDNATKDIRLGEDMTIEPSNTLNVPEGADIVFNLDNHTLSADERDSTGAHTNVLTVSGKVTLKNGVINTRNILVYEGGELVIEDDVTINAMDADGGAAIWVYEGGKVIINGATITSESYTYAITNYGELVLNDATVEADRGCIAALAGAVEINGGTYTVRNERDDAAHVVYASDGYVTVNGGTFTNEADGYKFCVDPDGSGEIKIGDTTLTAGQSKND